MFKKAPLFVNKDRAMLRNQSNNTKPLRDVKNIVTTRQSLSRNPSTSKLVLQSCGSTQHDSKNSPSSSIESYLRQHQPVRSCKIRSPFITEEMRKISVEWMLEISHHTKLKRETSFIGVYLLDQMLSIDREVTTQNIQLLAMTVLFIASKYQEIYSAKIEQSLKYSANSYSRAQLLAMEDRVLTMTQFKLTFPTRYTFYGLMQENINTIIANSYDSNYRTVNAKKFSSLIVFLLEMSLLCLWEDASQSDLAEAAYLLTCKVMKVNSPMVSDSVMELAYKLMGVWRENEGRVLASLYDNQKYCFVGGLKIIY